MGSKRAWPFSSTPAVAAPSGELTRICSGRVERPPAAASTISSTARFPGQRRCRVGLSPAIQAVVRSPSTRLRGLSERPEPKLVESAVAVMRSFCRGATRSSSWSSSGPGTARALADTSYDALAPVRNWRCSPTSAETGERPPGSLPRCREYVADGAVDFSSSVGSCSSRVTCTSGIDTSERPAPDSPARGVCDPVIVIFSHFATPAGALTCCFAPLVSSWLSMLPRSVWTRTEVGAARMPSPGSGVSPISDGTDVGRVKPIRSHWPTGSPALPSAQPVSGFPSKACTGSYCGRWNSQLPLLEAVTEAAPRSTPVVWWSMPSEGRIWRGGRPGSWTLSG